MSEKFVHYTIEPPESLIFTPSDDCGLQSISSVNPQKKK